VQPTTEAGGVSGSTSCPGNPATVGTALPVQVKTYWVLKEKTRPKRKDNEMNHNPSKITAMWILNKKNTIQKFCLRPEQLYYNERLLSLWRSEKFL